MFNDIDHAKFLRRDYLREYWFEDTRPTLSLSTFSRFAVQNISEEPALYRSFMHITEGLITPTLRHVHLWRGGKLFPGSIDWEKCPDRKKVLQANSAEMILDPGEIVTVDWHIQSSVDTRDSDLISFGMATDGVTIRAYMPLRIGVIVDQLRQPIYSSRGIWCFEGRFENEQHIIVRWDEYTQEEITRATSGRAI